MSDDLSSAEKAARLRAAWHRFQASRADTEAAAFRLGGAAARFTEALQTGTDREIAEHPDLAEISVMLRGYYEDPQA
ncbi:hypothetical protein [Streptomyces sp. NPDC002533]